MTMVIGNGTGAIEILAQVAQIAIGIASVVVAFVAVRISKQTAEKQGENQISSIRAYVLINTPSLVDFGRDKPVRLRCRIQNVGSTPAIGLRLDSEKCVVSVHDNAPLHRLRIPASKGEMLVAPNGQLFLENDAANGLVVSGEDWKEIETGAKKIRFTVAVEYRDIAGKSRYTSVAWLLGADQLAANPNGPHLTYENRAFQIV